MSTESNLTQFDSEKLMCEADSSDALEHVNDAGTPSEIHSIISPRPKKTNLLEKLFMDPDLKDLTLVSKNSIEEKEGNSSNLDFRVNRAIFANLSEPLKTLLYPDTASKQKIELPERIEMDMVSSEALEALIRYAYTLRFDITPQNVVMLIQASRNLDIKGFEDEIYRSLPAQWSAKNILQFYSVLVDQGIPETLERDIWVEILRRAQSIVETGFGNCDERILLKLCKSDIFFVYETSLFEAVDQWCTLNSKPLNPFLPLLRLDLLDKQYFIDKVAQKLPRDVLIERFAQQTLGKKSCTEQTERRHPWIMIHPFRGKYNVFQSSHQFERAKKLSEYSDNPRNSRRLNFKDAWRLRNGVVSWLLVKFRDPVNIRIIQIRRTFRGGEKGTGNLGELKLDAINDRGETLGSRVVDILQNSRCFFEDEEKVFARKWRLIFQGPRHCESAHVHYLAFMVEVDSDAKLLPELYIANA